jgi:uncharacterized protein YndB with AHSA1/START domain
MARRFVYKQVVLTRKLRHPPARVFAAWTNREQMQRFYGT